MNNLTNVTTATPNTQQNVQSRPIQTQVVENEYVAQHVQSAQTSQALFTQEQLNSIIQGRVNPLNQRVQDLTNQLAQAQQLSQSYLNELTGYKNRETVIAAGVPAQFADFVTFEANKLAINGKSFADAVKEYTTANAQLFNINRGIQNTQPTQNVIPVAGQVGSQTANQNQSVAQNQQVNNVSSPVGNVKDTSKNNVDSSVIQGNIGTSSFTGVANPNGVNDIDSAVDAFLRKKGVRK